jgi:ABC-type tungstate transport system permease subunit
MNTKDILIYRNKHTNMICRHVNEAEPSRAKHLTVKEVAKLIGFKWYMLRKREFERLIYETRVEGKPVFVIFNDGEKIAVNPHLRRPLNDSSRRLLTVLFN